MKDHVNIPMFRGQNGWTREGWRSISMKFDQSFPFAHFTKEQLQEKEELKGNWKAIRDARKESGVGWNDSMAMINAEPEKWKKLISDNAKMAKFRKKPFPLFEDCTSLYAGSVATGELNFTSTEHLTSAAAVAPPCAPLAPRAPLAPTGPLARAPSTAPASIILAPPAPIASDRSDRSAHNEAQSSLNLLASLDEAQSAPPDSMGASGTGPAGSAAAAKPHQGQGVVVAILQLHAELDPFHDRRAQRRWLTVVHVVAAGHARCLGHDSRATLPRLVEVLDELRGEKLIPSYEHGGLIQSSFSFLLIAESLLVAIHDLGEEKCGHFW